MRPTGWFLWFSLLLLPGQAIAIAPKLVSARIDLGNFYRFVKRDYKKAAIQLEEAINLSPNDAIAHGGLAAIYADQGELQRAEREFREALRITPNAYGTKTELAYVLEREGRYDESEMLFKGVIAKFPSFYRAHEGLARVYQSKKELVKAEEEAKTSVALRKDEGTLEVLAAIYSDEGDTAHARKFWKAVLAKNPHDVEAQRHLGLLDDSDSGSGKTGDAGSKDTGTGAGDGSMSRTAMGVSLGPNLYVGLLVGLVGVRQ